MNGQFRYTDNIELARHRTKISKTKRHNKTQEFKKINTIDPDHVLAKGKIPADFLIYKYILFCLSIDEFCIHSRNFISIFSFSSRRLVK